MTDGRKDIAGWILFDDTCGICRRIATLTSTVLRRRGFVVDRLQSGWVGPYFGMSQQDLVKDIRLVRSGGTNVEGADVYRFVMKRIWWAVPLYYLSVVPCFKTIFDMSYRMFADHRHLFSRSCAAP